MAHAIRSRRTSAMWLVLIIACGLGSRMPGMPQFSALYLGDVLWGSMFFVLYAGFWPAARSRRVWGWAAGTTVAIELSQLWKTPWLVGVRTTSWGKLLLGDTFLWSDLVCVVLGASAAALADAASSALSPAAARLRAAAARR